MEDENSSKDRVMRELRERGYRLLTETLHEGIWIIDSCNNTVFVNSQMAEMMGYTPDEMVGTDLFSFMDENHVEICKKKLEIRKKGMREQYEFELVKKDGRSIPLLLAVSPVIDKNERYLGAIASIRDITAWKRTERMLRDTKERYRSLTEEIADVLIRISLRGTIIYMSKRVERMTGYARKEIVGKNIKEILTSESYEVAKERLKKWRDGAEEQPPYEVEVKTKDSRTVPFELNTSPIKENGELIAIQIVAREITKRKKAERALKESKEIYRKLSEFNEKLLESSPMGILYINEEMNVEYENSEMQRISGLSLGKRWESLGMNIGEIPFIAESGASSLLEDLVKKTPIGEEISLTSSSGERIYLTMKGVPLVEKNRFQGAILIINDITERKKMEHEKELMQREAEFYADVLAHDIGNINQTTLGHLYLLERAEEKEKRREEVAQIKKSIMRSKKLTENIGILKDAREKNLTRVSLEKTVRRTIRQVKKESEKDMKITYEADQKYYVTANSLLDVVFLNLLENAVIFTIDEPVRIDLWVEEQDDICAVHVRDYGLGISKEKRKDILKNLETLSKRTGMGLYVVKKILERFGGTFEIGDVPKGTEIIIWLQVVS